MEWYIHKQFTLIYQAFNDLHIHTYVRYGTIQFNYHIHMSVIVFVLLIKLDGSQPHKSYRN